MFAGMRGELALMSGRGGGDSEAEGELQDQTPDTDDSGAHSYPELSTTGTGSSALLGTTHSGGTSSFKRVPNMGKGVLEQRGKKSRTYPPKDTHAHAHNSAAHNTHKVGCVHVL